jgi:hypothetical protein
MTRMIIKNTEQSHIAFISILSSGPKNFNEATSPRMTEIGMLNAMNGEV